MPSPDTRGLSSARVAVLDLLTEAGGATSLAELTRASGLHPNTLREHLEALVARGLARRFRATPSGRGRPAWLYEASSEAGAAGSEYAGLAATLAAHIHRTSADPGRDAVSAGLAWGHELARSSAPPDDHDEVTARRQVVRLLDQVGFSPEASLDATTVRLTRCPLLDTAREFPDVVCGVHLGIVRGALDEYDADSDHTALTPFAEPGACLLELRTRQGAS